MLSREDFEKYPKGTNNQYKNERDIPDEIWNNYLLKYKKKYITFRDELNIVQIRTHKGYNEMIQLYSYNKNLLCSLYQFKTYRGIGNLIRKMPKYCIISQEGSSDCVMVFPEDKLDELEKLGIIKPYRRKRRIITEQQREKLRLQLSNARKATLNANQRANSA